MKNWKVKYQKGNDILITNMEVEEGVDPQYAFYMKYGHNVDIIEVTEEVEGEG